MTEREVTYEELCAAIDSHYQTWNPPLGFDHLKDRHMKVSGPWVPAFLSLLWITGGRVTEVLGLRGSDIKTEDIQLPNGEEVQVAYITLANLKQRFGRYPRKTCVTIMDEYPRLWEYIDRYHDQLWDPRTIMFPRSRKTAWYHANKIFGKGTHRVGRHSWVMEHARKGTNILDVKQQGGWSTMNSMNEYIHQFGLEEMKDRQVTKFLEKLRKGRV